jgi:hypothetical protein
MVTVSLPHFTLNAKVSDMILLPMGCKIVQLGVSEIGFHRVD